MRLALTDTPPHQCACDLLALPVPEPGILGGEAAEVDRRVGGRLSETAKAEGFSGKPGRTTLLHCADGPFRRVLVVGVGRHPDSERLRRYGAVVVRKAQDLHAASIAMAVDPADPNGLAADESVRAVAEGAGLGAYRFARYRKPDQDAAIDAVQLIARRSGRAALERALRAAEIGTSATCRARDLVNEPSNVLTPTALADAARDIAASAGLECRIIDLDEARRLGMGLFVAVAQGSAQPPKFIVLDYHPAGARRTIALVGKGVTFDSGGLSIKSASGMRTMKGDMAGAAAVVAAMGALRDLEVSVRVLGIAVATENMINGAAMRPGDIIRSLSGHTVEITNTDAEGRLLLADGLAYAVRAGADELIDVATLTGACVVALGDWTAGVMGRPQPLVDRLLAAAAASGEQLWQLPLYEEFLESMRGDITDFRNTASGREGGAERAAAFLGEFAGTVPWAHLDIAGPAFAEGTPPAPYMTAGGTGFGVRTLLRYLTSQ